MIDVDNKQHLKDCMFMSIAKTIAGFSKCSSRQIGAVVVKDGCVASTGFNGSARGVSDCQDRTKPCPRRLMGFKSGEGIEHCPAIHAEANAIIQAARIGVSTNGCTLYCWCNCICKNCAGTIINAGIKRLVFLDNGPDYDSRSYPHLMEAGIEVVKINPDDVM